MLLRGLYAHKCWCLPNPEDLRDIVTIACGCLPLPSHDLSQCVPSFPDPADHGPLRVAVVRRRTGGMDHLHALFSDHIGRRLRLRSLVGLTARDPKAGLDTPRVAGDFAPVSAARAARDSGDTCRKRRSFGSHSLRTRGFGRRPLLDVVRDRSVVAALVPPQPSRPIALASVFVVEP